MNIGIKAVSMYQPDEYIDNISQAKVLDSTEDFIIPEELNIPIDCEIINPVKSDDDESEDIEGLGF